MEKESKMRIIELENLFKKEETLNKVLEMLQEDFDKTDYWSGVRKMNLTDNSEEINKALNELSGVYSNLRTALGIAETVKRNREVRYKESIRAETENAGNKYTDSKASTQASAHVANYRRVRNIIEAYCESCDKHIITLQSILKDLNKDYKHPQG